MFVSSLRHDFISIGISPFASRLLTINYVLQHELLQDIYETTLEALKEAKNDRLWFKTNLKVPIITHAAVPVA